MTDFKMGCSEKCSREYVKMSMMGTTFTSMLPMVICAALLTAIPIIGVIGFFMTNSVIMLIAGGCGLLIGAGVVIFLRVSLNRAAKKLRAVYEKLDGLVCSVAEDSIIIVRDNAPHRVIDWRDVEAVLKGKDAYYLKIKDNMLIILEKDSVLSGTFEETEELMQSRFGDSK
ncbi:MAG: YcxB family protein [Ruminiclostridium sp.]|nr:YcxB family protein [Ruminiclostridium sp.]